MTAREAMAYGRPVVATGVGGLRELAPAARLVGPGDLRGAIEELLADADERAHLGSTGRELAQSSFSRQVESERLLGAYEDALHARRSSSRGVSDSSDAK
jgi:glycosyltransferase involved in cell wall biosynthesis